MATDAPAALKRAPEIQSRSVSDSVTAAAQEAAYRTIEQAQMIRLFVEDQRAFAEFEADSGSIKGHVVHRLKLRRLRFGQIRTRRKRVKTSGGRLPLKNSPRCPYIRARVHGNAQGANLHRDYA